MPEKPAEIGILTIDQVSRLRGPDERTGYCHRVIDDNLRRGSDPAVWAALLVGAPHDAINKGHEPGMHGKPTETRGHYDLRFDFRIC